MEASEKNILGRWRKQMVEEIQHHRSLYDILESEEVLPKVILSKIKSQSDTREQVRLMLDSIQKRPVFNKFYNCLIQSDNALLADLLKPELAEDRLTQESLDKKCTHYYKGQGDTAAQPEMESQRRGSTTTIPTQSTDDLETRPEERRASVTNPSVQCSEDLERIGLSDDGPDPDWTPDKVKVYSTDRPHLVELFQTVNNQYYDMRTHPRGRAVIVCNNKFPETILKATFNRENDVKALKNLLSGLDYETDFWEDCSKQELLEKLELESRNQNLRNFGSFMMFILTHGTDAGLYMNDGSIITVEEIIDYFTSSRCEYLCDKPKLFFIQSCRGNKKDTGEKKTVSQGSILDRLYSRTAVAETSGADVTDSGADVTDAGAAVDDLDDLFVANATSPGYKSYGYSGKHSTWYIQTLTEVLSKKSCEEDIGSMLDMVHDLMSKLRTKANAAQTPHVTHNSLTKKLYFFPGLQ